MKNEASGIKVKDLIEALNGCDQEAHVSIQIEQYNKAYPVAYAPVLNSNWSYPTFLNKAWEGSPGNSIIRIICSLPDNMRTSVHEKPI